MRVLVVEREVIVSMRVVVATKKVFSIHSRFFRERTMDEYVINKGDDISALRNDPKSMYVD